MKLRTIKEIVNNSQRNFGSADIIENKCIHPEVDRRNKEIIELYHKQTDFVIHKARMNEARDEWHRLQNEDYWEGKEKVKK